MAAPMPVHGVTFEQWLEHEETSDVRHELVDGELYAMAGAKRRHNLLMTELSFHLRGAAKEHGCRVYTAEMRLRVSDLRGYYPDVMVVCEPPEDEDFETEPCLVVEILSRSTARIDRTEKLEAYLTLPSLQAYVVVAPDRPALAVHRPGQPPEALGPDDTLRLDCPPLALDVATLYDGID